MKFCAPKANWNPHEAGSWWPLVGSAPTSSGVRVSQESALTYSAVFACTRVISETLASMPLFLLEQVNDKTTRKATEHPLYPVLHDMPNPEMEITTFLDTQSASQLNWGNAYSEIQRDVMGRVVALWPIHPSRIPLCNIYRNGTSGSDVLELVVGQPGELVYEVKNDDGTVSPIPASDMLHIPGVLSRNGITGTSIILAGAEAIGIGMATEQHAGAFFRNGAAATVAISSPKVIGKETAERLRAQWQSVYGGVRNHYKTLLLEDGMEPKIFSLSPEASQLIESRALSHRVVASQLYRVPSHMIGDKEASTYNNVEQEEIAFAKKTMLIWVTRWEKAIFRQLLTAEEQKRYRPKFNMMGLLRGDSQSRGQFYQVLVNIGALSPNDIRELEDMNPVEGGDQYFVPVNNLTPLHLVEERAQAEIDKLKAPAPVPQAPQRPEPDEETAKRLLEFRAELREFLIKVELRDASREERETAEREFDRQQRERDHALYGKALEDVAAGYAKLSDKINAQPPAPAPVVDTAPIVELVQAGVEAIREQIAAAPPTDLSPVLAKLDDIANRPQPEIPAPVVDTAPIVAAVREQIADQPPHAPAPVDTSAAEALAVREAELASRTAAIEAERESRQQALRNLVAVALQREINQLADWEWKWLQKAVDKPLEWVSARGEYYARFRRHFEANLGEYVPQARACGIELDVKWGADRYAGESIRDLKSLDPAAADNYHDRLKDTVNIYRNSQWTGRAAALAQELVERGSRTSTTTGA